MEMRGGPQCGPCIAPRQNMLETCFGPFKYDFRMAFENCSLVFFQFFGFSGGGVG